MHPSEANLSATARASGSGDAPACATLAEVEEAAAVPPLSLRCRQIELA